MGFKVLLSVSLTTDFAFIANSYGFLSYSTKVLSRHVQNMSTLGGYRVGISKIFRRGYRGGYIFDDEMRKQPGFGLNLTKLTLI